MALLALGLGVRAATAVAYWPGVLTPDSYTYVAMAHETSFVGVRADRPSGYPLLLDVLDLTGSRVASVTVAQHLATLAIGAIVYALLLRLGSRRGTALAAAAVLVVGADLMVAGQFLMTEAFSALALAAAALLVAGRDRGPAALAASGALLAVAAALRTAALFAVPVWLAYMVWAHRAVRPVAAASAALAIPLVAYCSWHAAEAGRFSFTDADGWFLYGRVAEFADCGEADEPAEARPLCVRPPPEAEGIGPAFYVFNPESPARRAFGGVEHPDEDRRAHVNALMRSYAFAAIRAEPATYLRVVGRDFAKFFEPTDRRPFRLRASPYLGFDAESHPEQVEYVLDIRRRHLPGFEPEVDGPDDAVRGYARWVRLHPPVLGLLALAAAVAILAGLAGRRRGWVPRRAEIALLGGMGLAMLLGAAATSDYTPRYAVPALALLIAGGALAIEDLARLLRAGRSTDRLHPRHW